MTTQATLIEAVEQLLAAGATLQLTNPDGTTEAWPLARHARVDDDVLWIRPIVGGRRTGTGSVVFPLGDCRRRGIAIDEWTQPVTGIRFELAGGQSLEIRPATAGDETTTLELWDTFVLTVLTAAEEADLDALDADSWHGRFT